MLTYYCRNFSVVRLRRQKRILATKHQISFVGTRSTLAMSLCETELASPSSQEMVTSLQDVPVTVPRSVVVAPQQTRSPTLRCLDWSPVMDRYFCLSLETRYLRAFRALQPRKKSSPYMLRYLPK